MQAILGQIYSVSNSRCEGRGLVLLEERGGAMSPELGDL